MRGPETSREKRESKSTIPELVELFADQARLDIERGRVGAELMSEVRKKLANLAHGNEREQEHDARNVVQTHVRTLVDDIGLENVNQQIAYVIALAREIAKDKKQSH